MNGRKIFALLAAALLVSAGITGAYSEEESSMSGTTLKGLGITPGVSYKKAGENNPLYTQRFGADPGVMEYNGRLYVYTTDDIVERNAAGQVAENTYGKIKTINCISSDDLVNWTDHGRIPVAGSSGIAKWAQNSWAPCAAHKTIDGKEKFFLYFCNGGNGIGVLAADDPAGPWRDELGHLLITRSTPNCANVTWLFDPAVMVDEDGTGYLAFGGGVPDGKQAAPGTGRIVRLSEDMMHLGCDPVTLDVPWLFEDSGINRIGDTYIYSYCSNWQTDGNPLRLKSGAIQYMTAEDPLGPYTYAGQLFPNEGEFFGMYGNNHHSIISLNGEYYLFYHNRPVEKAMGITGNYRSPQADRIVIAEDGSLKSVVGTMKGLSQLHPLDGTQRTPAAAMSHQAGILVRDPDENNVCAVNGEAGSWIRVTGVDFGSGVSEITVEAAVPRTAPQDCELYVLTDSLENPVAARIPLVKERKEYTVPFSAEGVHDLYFVFGGVANVYTWQAK